MLRIILDCDDVLYQTNEAALKRLNEKLGTAYTLGNITKWGKISPDLDYRMEYFQNPDFIQDLPVYDGASEFIVSFSLLAYRLVVQLHVWMLSEETFQW